MSPAAEKVLEQFYALTPEEQDRVREGVAQHADQVELHPAWDDEIRRRIKAVQDGEMETIPAEVVHAEMRRMLDEL